MRQGQRPQDHVRRVRTKRGRKAVRVNSHIHRPLPVKHRQEQSRAKVNVWDMWSKKAALATIDDYTRDESGDIPQMNVQITEGQEGGWHAGIGIGWYRGPEIMDIAIDAKDVASFDDALRRYIVKAMDITEGQVSMTVRILFVPNDEATILDAAKTTAQKLDQYLKQGGKVLEKLITEDLKNGDFVKNVLDSKNFTIAGMFGEQHWFDLPVWDINRLNLAPPRSKAALEQPSPKAITGSVQRPMLPSAPRANKHRERVPLKDTIKLRPRKRELLIAPEKKLLEGPR